MGDLGASEMCERARLIDIASLRKGTEPGRASYCAPPEGIRFLRVGDISGKVDNPVNTTAENVVLCDRLDLLMSFDGTPGIVARGFEGAISSGIRIIEPNERKVLRDYLYFYLQTDFVQQTIRQYSTGATLVHASKAIPYIEVMLPLLEVQRRIATILEKAEALRRRREQANQLTNKIIQSFFLKIFGDPVSNKNHWPVKTIREVAEKVSDGPFGSNLMTKHYTAEGVRVIRLQNIGVGEFIDDDKVFISLEHYSKLKKHTCIPGDVIVGTLGDPNLRACILPDYVEVAINKADCVQVRPNKNFVNAEYLCHLLNTPQMLRLASSYIHGETRTRISMSQVASLQIPVPPSSIQEEYAQTMQHFGHVHANQKRSSEVINGLFHSLMHKAFRGQLALGESETSKPNKPLIQRSLNPQ